MSTSLSDWMSDADYEWRQRLAPVRLVIETDFSADEVRDAQRNAGRAARHLLNQVWSHEEIIKRYPALTLVILVGHAALAYDQGAYWQSFWDELGLAHDANFENEIRRQLPTLLDKFSLARFPDIERGGGNKYVMTLALHAGIPIHCLRDLLVVINDHIVQGRLATGAGVMEWLQEPGKGVPRERAGRAGAQLPDQRCRVRRGHTRPHHRVHRRSHCEPSSSRPRTPH